MTNTAKKAWLPIIMAILVVLLLFLGFQWYQKSQKTETLQVTGTAKEFFTPDRLNVQLAIVEIQDDQAKAVTKVEERLKVIEEKASEVGIDKELLQKGTVNITPWYDYNNPTQDRAKEETQKRRVEQSITIRVDNTPTKPIASVASALTTVIAQNTASNDTFYFSYDFANRDEVVEKLRTKALENAKKKAENTVNTLNVRLGKITSINDNSSIVFPMNRGYDNTVSREIMLGGNGLATSPQDQELEFSITVTYELKQRLSIF